MGPTTRSPATGRLELALLCTLLAACSASATPSRVLRLESIRPRNVHGVYLNEDLVLTFSAEVDAESLLRHGVRIQDPAGDPALGDWFVEGKQLRFSPAPVRMRNLSDGGYRPGTRYTVEILGFPRLDAVRDVEGRPLDATRMWTFETVAVTEERTGFVFEDASPAHAEPLRLVRDREWMGPEDAVLLECAEPLDPSSIDDEDFALIPEPELPVQRRTETTESVRPIELRAVLLVNQDEGEAPPGQACAVLALHPRKGPLAPGRYSLRLARPLDLRDFGGNAVTPISWEHQWGGIRVAPPGAEGERGRLHLSFLDKRWSSPLALPGVDGTAHWDEDGRVSIRYPEAAGDGLEGEVLLGERETRRDVQATHLTLPRGTRCAMDGPGLRVLRAQGRVTLSGELVRESSGPSERMLVIRDEVVGPVRNLLRGLPLEVRRACEVLSMPERLAPRRALSEWLAAASERDPSWTIVIAGGDLVIDGSVRVDTPLLLVAGGLIRTSGRGTVGPVGEEMRNQLFLLGGGGGWNLDRTASEVDHVVIDPPTRNPLRTPLRYGVLSVPVPASSLISQWIDAYADGSPRAGQEAATGRWSLRFLPADAPLEPDRLRDHPTLIDRVGPVKLWIELEVQPGDMWNPPFLDFVRLSWEEREN